MPASAESLDKSSTKTHKLTWRIQRLGRDRMQGDALISTHSSMTNHQGTGEGTESRQRAKENPSNTWGRLQFTQHHPTPEAMLSSNLSCPWLYTIHPISLLQRNNWGETSQTRPAHQVYISPRLCFRLHTQTYIAPSQYAEKPRGKVEKGDFL